MRYSFLFSLFLCTLFLVPQTVGAQGKQLTNKEIWASNRFNSKSVRGVRSMNDGLHYTSLESDRGGLALNKYAYKTGKKAMTIVQESDLIPAGKKEAISIETYSFSADESKMLIGTDVERIYRHSTRANYYIYEIATKKLTELVPGKKKRYATFSPDGSRVAYVSENNLYVSDLSTGKALAITKDGKNNEVIYGATDWVYEEEFAFDKAFFWSPDGQKIAYYRFDESHVREFNMPIYRSLYPDEYRFKYPKAGEKNALVSVLFFDLQKKQAFDFDLGGYEYIPRVKWSATSEFLVIYTMPRLQNKLTLKLLDTENKSVSTLLEESSDTYIDITDDLTFLKNNKGFIWTSEKSGFNHIYYYNFKSKEGRQITKGSWDVKEYLGMNEDKGILYYSSAEDSPVERHLYSVNLDGSTKTKLTSRKGTNRAVFSKGFKYYINYQSDANTPSYISLHDAKGKMIRELENNAGLNAVLKEYSMSPKEFFAFKTSEGTELNGWMIKPADFDANKKYPVLMFVYGGPGSQTVLDSWGRNYLWHQMMAQKGYLIVSVDNRGTGSRGRDFKNCTYKQLGKYETEDQIEAAKYLQKQSYVDNDRIGIWGWSYGGYMSSLCLTKGADVFKTGIAVAPVTNWRYYDSIYTERYMQTPQENPDGYDDNSPINHVAKLEGNFLLVHGSADDNVHYQNTMEMINALVNANRDFDMMIYPNRNHGIYGGNTRLHLFNKITDFLLDEL